MIMEQRISALQVRARSTSYTDDGYLHRLPAIVNDVVCMTSQNDATHNASYSVRTLSVIFDKNLSFAQHTSSISKSCFLNIRDLRRIRNTIDQTTACTIATSLIHSKID